MLTFLVLSLWLQTASAEPASQPPQGVIDGVVSTSGGGEAIRLPGALVTVLDPANHEIATQVTDGEGRFEFSRLPSGRYRVVASLDGFKPAAADAVVNRDTRTSVALEVAVAASEHVEVSAPAALRDEHTIAPAQSVNATEREQFAPGGGLGGALRLLASVFDAPGGLSIKGGRPDQTGMQLDVGTLSDPAIGVPRFTLPDDAIETVTVLPNPYAVEFGRFSSGLVLVRSRRAGEAWKVRVSDPVPTFRTDRQNPFDVRGVASFNPRIEAGGPIAPGRLFVEQTGQFRYNASDVPSRPQNELRTSSLLSALTRVDATLTPRHTLVGMFGAVPSRAADATLGTFTPPDATVNLSDRATLSGATERAVWSDSVLTEATLRVNAYRIDADPQGAAPMRLLPETTLGNFFNRQRRETTTVQWVTTMSATREGPGGLHFVKAGFDLLSGSYAGFSASDPLQVLASDGTLTRQLTFDRRTRQSAGDVDAALFFQDRLQPTSRWYIEAGGRIDRDGVTRTVNVTPRVGTALLLDADGRSTIRGGYGLFFEQTPLVAAAFPQFESFTDARFAPDGLMPESAVHFVRTVAPALQTPRSASADVEFEQRLSSAWTVRAGALDRNGSSALIVRPFVTAPGAGDLRLSSDGRSSYRSVDVGVRFHQPRGTVDATYTWSRSLGDLNTLALYADTLLRPIVGANAYAPTPMDVPHRLLARASLLSSPTWLFTTTVDWHTGTPYSTVDRELDFVGARNVLRLPTAFRVDLGAEHRMTLFKWRPWVGVRVANALNAFLPGDVQANVDSPAFGSLYNSPFRQFRLQLRFER